MLLAPLLLLKNIGLILLIGNLFPLASRKPLELLPQLKFRRLPWLLKNPLLYGLPKFPREIAKVSRTLTDRV